MTSARPDTWMPVYWGDYARDTGDLGAALHGAYLMLIKHYWCTGAPLADDDASLWRIATCDSIAHWRKLRPTLSRFFQIGDGLWRHKRVDAELEKATEFLRRQSQNGRKGGRPRKPDETQPETQTKPTGIPKPNPKITTSPSPSPNDDVLRPPPLDGLAEPRDPQLELAREIIAAYCRAVQEIWNLPTAPRPKWGTEKGDLPIATAWARDGVTLALVLEVLGPVLTAKRDSSSDNGAPGGLIYLDKAVRRKLAEIVGKPVEPVDPAKEAAATAYIERVEAWKAGGKQGEMPRLENLPGETLIPPGGYLPSTPSGIAIKRLRNRP